MKNLKKNIKRTKVMKRLVGAMLCVCVVMGSSLGTQAATKLKAPTLNDDYSSVTSSVIKAYVTDNNSGSSYKTARSNGKITAEVYYKKPASDTWKHVTQGFTLSKGYVKTGKLSANTTYQIKVRLKSSSSSFFYQRFFEHNKIKNK